jgi:hypothetical protein
MGSSLKRGERVNGRRRRGGGLGAPWGGAAMEELMAAPLSVVLMRLVRSVCERRQEGGRRKEKKKEKEGKEKKKEKNMKKIPNLKNSEK